MNQKLKYGLVFLLLSVVAIVLFWPQPQGNEELQEEKSSVRELQSRDSVVRKNLGNVPPVKERLSAEQLAKIEQEKGKGRLEKMKELIRNDYNTPINFWGKVIDENGTPLANAKAEITVDEHAANKKYTTFSDDEGMFELLGKRGARARIKVFLNGCAPTSDEKIGSRISARTIYYSSKAMPAYAPPTKENPQIFVLRKKNPIANLSHAFKKQASIGKAGDAQKIELAAAGKTIGVEVRCWSYCPVPFTYDRYDWQAEIKIEGGKLRTITELEPVTAPIEGYQQVFQLGMPKDTKDNWLRSSPNGQRDFWVQFDDGTYAKARIEVKTGRKHEVDVEVWYNLDGTNNFEQ
jgi:hypothetical protein